MSILDTDATVSELRAKVLQLETIREEERTFWQDRVVAAERRAAAAERRLHDGFDDVVTFVRQNMSQQGIGSMRSGAGESVPCTPLGSSDLGQPRDDAGSRATLQRTGSAALRISELEREIARLHREKTQLNQQLFSIQRALGDQQDATEERDRLAHELVECRHEKEEVWKILCELEARLEGSTTSDASPTLPVSSSGRRGSGPPVAPLATRRLSGAHRMAQARTKMTAVDPMNVITHGEVSMFGFSSSSTLASGDTVSNVSSSARSVASAVAPQTCRLKAIHPTGPETPSGVTPSGKGTSPPVFTKSSSAKSVPSVPRRGSVPSHETAATSGVPAQAGVDNRTTTTGQSMSRHVASDSQLEAQLDALQRDFHSTCDAVMDSRRQNMMSSPPNSRPMDPPLGPVNRSARHSSQRSAGKARPRDWQDDGGANSDGSEDEPSRYGHGPYTEDYDTINDVICRSPTPTRP